MTKLAKITAIIFSCLLLQACILQKTIIKKDVLEMTENSAFTEDGRFFVIGVDTQTGDSAIFQIKKNWFGQYYKSEYVKGEIASINKDCVMGGLTSKGNTLYAVCGVPFELLNHDVPFVVKDVYLFEVDATPNAKKVRVGKIGQENYTSRNGEPFNPGAFFANGMAVDDDGDIYISNSAAILLGNKTAIEKVTIEGTEANNASNLILSHTPWIVSGDYSGDVFPNGVQIEGDVLYYVSQDEIRKVRINDDGSPGEQRIHYKGLLIDGYKNHLIDDFEIWNGYIAFASTIISKSVVILPPADFEEEKVKPIETINVDYYPSSVRFQPEGEYSNPLFRKNALLVTSFFGGGLYELSPW